MLLYCHNNFKVLILTRLFNRDAHSSTVMLLKSSCLQLVFRLCLLYTMDTYTAKKGESFPEAKSKVAKMTCSP